MIKIKMLKHATCVLLVGQQVYPNRDGVTTIYSQWEWIIPSL